MEYSINIDELIRSIIANSGLPFIAAIFSVIIGALFTARDAYKSAIDARKSRPIQEPYQDRLFKLLDNLKKSSDDFDVILHGMSSVATSREQAVRKLEADLIDLENKEKEIKDRVDNLRNVPIPVAEHLAKLMEPEGKKSAKRDYFLFLSGVVVSTIIAIVLEIYFK